MNFLLIDDDVEELEIFGIAEADGGMSHSWDQALSSGKGVHTLLTNFPAAVFIDFNMPGISGIECAKRIRLIPGHTTTCLILYSTSMSDEMRLQAAITGIDFCFQKPASIPEVNELISFISNHLLQRGH
ncbi:MAG: response regulator [Chitinophagaceae bacterium]|nr:MAG: response regulator [Chitinophagaceae bacterium]